MMTRYACQLSVLVLLVVMTGQVPTVAGPNRYQFWAMTRFDRSTCALTSGGTARRIFTTPVIASVAAWKEIIVSWNADVPRTSAMEVLARGVTANHATRWYSLGYWAAQGHKPVRTSRPGQDDADGRVETDTLVLKRLAPAFQVRVVMDRSVTLRFLGVSLTSPAAVPTTLVPNRRAWGVALPVPGYSQLTDPKGEGWCSPACVSMVLAYWGQQGHHAEWKRDVPLCAAGIYDKARDGTGNWSFNTAYAGALPGLRAYVNRLEDIRSLEDWIVQGVPVILAVSVNLRSGKDLPGASGHLIICTGFTRTGDLIVNDPWTHLARGESVRRVIPRHRLGTLWAKSEHTVYIIHPTDQHPTQETTFL